MAERKPFRDTPKRTTRRARQLRQEATVPERILWGLLRGKQISGLRFRRQYPVAGFIVDFYCAEARLAIELDGVSHLGRRANDAERTRILQGHGLRVIRFTNDELLQGRDVVANVIDRTVRHMLASQRDGVSTIKPPTDASPSAKDPS